MAQSQGDTVYVHVTNGDIWAETLMTRPTRLGPASNAAGAVRAMAPRWRRARALGTPANAVLVSEALRSGAFDAVETASPRLFGGEKGRPGPRFPWKPSFAAEGARLRLPASVGGWREVGPREAPVYHLCARVHGGRGLADDDAALNAVKEGPVLSALSFLCDAEWLAMVMAHLIDPRFHVLARDPDDDGPFLDMCGFGPSRHEDAAEAAVRQSLARAWAGGACRNATQASFSYRYVSDVGGRRAMDRWLALFLRDLWRDDNAGGTGKWCVPRYHFEALSADATRLTRDFAVHRKGVEGRRAAGG